MRVRNCILASLFVLLDVSPMHHLTHFPPQSRIRINKIEADEQVVRKLASMGILPDVEVEVLHSSKKNSLVVIKRHNRRIVLRCNEALAIFCTLV